MRSDFLKDSCKFRLWQSIYWEFGGMIEIFFIMRFGLIFFFMFFVLQLERVCCSVVFFVLVQRNDCCGGEVD